MSASLHRLLHDHPHARRRQLPVQHFISPAPFLCDTPLDARGERLATRNELDTLRSMHPRRIAADG